MRKRDTWLWVIYGFVLLFLYLISSTDLLIKERKKRNLSGFGDPG